MYIAVCRLKKSFLISTILCFHTKGKKGCCISPPDKDGGLDGTVDSNRMHNVSFIRNLKKGLSVNKVRKVVKPLKKMCIMPLTRLLWVLSAQLVRASIVRSRMVQIPEDYDKTTAPPLVDGKPNVIKITADIFSIPDFDEKDEV